MIRFSLDREERGMKRKRHSPEEVINKLREAEILIQKGQEVPQACRQIGVTAQTYYRRVGLITRAPCPRLARPGRHPPSWPRG